jgi:FlaA1/EpsC-like NDP-sugar epimerase
MGRPVRIDDLARRLINLMGLTVRDEGHPDGDIEIEYTGLRTAEKLFEELVIGSNVTGTDHPMIMRAMEHHLPWSKMQEILNDLLVALASFDCHRALGLLTESVAEYESGAAIRDYVWTSKAVAPHAPAAKVADFAARRRQSEGGKPAPGPSPIP